MNKKLKWLVPFAAVAASACLSVAMFAGCGEDDPEKKPDDSDPTPVECEHEWSSEYVFDADGHWQVCEKCGEESEHENHEFDLGDCFCGYHDPSYVEVEPVGEWVNAEAGDTTTLTVYNNGTASVVGNGTMTFTFTWTYDETAGMVFKQDGYDQEFTVTSEDGVNATIKLTINVTAGGQTMQLEKTFTTDDFVEITGKKVALAVFSGNTETFGQVTITPYNDGSAALAVGGNETLINWSYEGGKLVFIDPAQPGETFEATITGNTATLHFTKPLMGEYKIDSTLTCADISGILTGEAPDQPEQPGVDEEPEEPEKTAVLTFSGTSDNAMMPTADLELYGDGTAMLAGREEFTWEYKSGNLTFYKGETAYTATITDKSATLSLSLTSPVTINFTLKCEDVSAIAVTVPQGAVAVFTGSMGALLTIKADGNAEISVMGRSLTLTWKYEDGKLVFTDAGQQNKQFEATVTGNIASFTYTGGATLEFVCYDISGITAAQA